ncbi:gephyrin-like molybdotransferase Glp [Methylocella sp.]|uniref:molybdopterin molybdotransferase MoeA n=1 Tax=Methylocella sp. TaxID=1978226 RepID=UPI0037837B80
MAQLSDDVFAAGEAPMTIEQAVGFLLARVADAPEIEQVGLHEADGRILAQDVTAARCLPGFDNCAVDGYAARFADLALHGDSVLKIGARAAAGRPLERLAPGPADFAGAAVRIFTGAAMPDGFDTAFMQEDCRRLEGGEVVLPAGLKRFANVRRRGEDVATGDVALKAGRRLRPEDLALAAALGLPTLPLRRRVTAALFSTGDELASPGERLGPGGAYDANRFMLAALLRRQGVEVSDLGVLPDERRVIAAALREAAGAHDLVLSSGGVSVGEEDHVRAAILERGSLDFWRLAVKPGRPLAMGVLDGTPFVGLPGNPVAAFIGFIFVARALVAALGGAVFEPPRFARAVAGFSYKKKPGRREFVRVSLVDDGSGLPRAEKYPLDGAAALTSLTRTQGLVALPEALREVAPGDVVSFVDYDLIR